MVYWFYQKEAALCRLLMFSSGARRYCINKLESGAKIQNHFEKSAKIFGTSYSFASAASPISFFIRDLRVHRCSIPEARAHR